MSVLGCNRKSRQQENKGYLPDQTSALMRVFPNTKSLWCHCWKFVLFGNVEWNINSPVKREPLETEVWGKVASFAFTHFCMWIYCNTCGLFEVSGNWFCSGGLMSSSTGDSNLSLYESDCFARSQGPTTPHFSFWKKRFILAHPQFLSFHPSFLSSKSSVQPL